MAGRTQGDELLVVCMGKGRPVRHHEQRLQLDRPGGGHGVDAGPQSERCEFRALDRAQRSNVVRSRTRCASFSHSLAARGFSFSSVLSGPPKRSGRWWLVMRTPQRTAISRALPQPFVVPRSLDGRASAPRERPYIFAILALCKLPDLSQGGQLGQRDHRRPPDVNEASEASAR
jgi:hypothetical protein